MNNLFLLVCQGDIPKVNQWIWIKFGGRWLQAQGCGYNLGNVRGQEKRHWTVVTLPDRYCQHHVHENNYLKMRLNIKDFNHLNGENISRFQDCDSNLSWVI